MSEKWMFPWEREAMRGAGMPDGLSLPDQMDCLTVHLFRLPRKTFEPGTGGGRKKQIAVYSGDIGIDWFAAQFYQEV